MGKSCIYRSYGSTLSVEAAPYRYLRTFSFYELRGGADKGTQTGIQLYVIEISMEKYIINKVEKNQG